MKGRKLLSILLVCCMLVSQPMAEAFAEEGSEAVSMRVDMETESAETEAVPAEEEQAAETVVETESESETGQGDSGSAEVMTETLTIEESETEEDGTLEETAAADSIEVAAEAATSGTCGANLTWTLEDGTLTISGTGAMEDYSYVAPWYNSRDKISKIIVYNGVTSIGMCAFQHCINLTSITLPNSVTSIDFGAFRGCSKLTSIVIPDSVTRIGEHAFHGCVSLESVVLPSSVVELGNCIFEGCVSLTSAGPIGGNYALQFGYTDKIPNGLCAGTGIESVVLPDSITEIGLWAFDGCSGLNDIVLPASLIKIESGAFRGCSNLRSVVIPDGVTSLRPEAFKNCSRLTHVVVPSSVVNAGYGGDGCGIFQGCTSLTSAGPIGGDYAFQFGHTDKIPEALFMGSGIKSVTLPDSVTSIGSSAFRECSSLTSIIIPDSVEYMGTQVFLNCTSLTSAGPVGGDYNIQFGWTSQIPSDAFHQSGIQKAVIPDGITKIGDGAFCGCSNLSSVIIPNSAYVGNYNLETRNGVFYGCGKLTSAGPIGGNYNIQFGWDTYIPSGAFFSSNVVSVTIPDGVTSIGSYAFSGCSSLTNIELPDSVKEIGGSAFRRCSSLTNIELPDTVTYISYDAFRDCTGLTNIIIPGSMTSIGEDVFHGCSSLMDIAIPNSVTKIRERAFYGCSSLTSITIPKSVTSIGTNAFYECSSLTDVYYGGTEDDWKAIDIGFSNDCLINATIHYAKLPDEIISGILRSGEGWEISWKCTYQSNSSGNPQNGRIEISVNDTNTVEELYLYNESGEAFPWELEPYNIPKSAIRTLVIRGRPTKKLRIPTNAFKGYSGLHTIVFEYVSGIDSYAFEDCASLQTVGFLNDGTAFFTIGEGAFKNCTHLTEMNFPASLEHIGAEAFRNTALKAITLGSGIQEIGKDAFSDCKNLLIYCDAGSYAHQYAQENNLPFALTADPTLNVQTRIFAFTNPNMVNLNWGWNLILNRSSSDYLHDTATVALALSAAAECSQSTIETMLIGNNFGADSIKSVYYGEDNEKNYPACTFAHKSINNGGTIEHIIIIVGRGTDLSSEDWKTDLGSVTDHFEEPASNVWRSFLGWLNTNDLADVVTSSNTKFFVTGHSLGGAVANRIAYRLTRDYGSANVYAYTFGTPPTEGQTSTVVPNIFNVLYDWDPVPFLGVFTDGRYGVECWFTDDSIGRFPNKHYVETYMDRLLKHEDAYFKKTTKSGGAWCPVDLKIYNSSGKLVGSVTDNTIDEENITDSVVIVLSGSDNDQKNFYFLEDDTYTIELKGTAEGTLTYTIRDTSADKKTIVEQIYANVKLYDGKQMSSKVSVWDKTDTSIDTVDKIDTEDVQLFVLDNNGEPEKEVLPDGKGTEVPVDGSSDNDTFDGVIPEDIPADGKIPNGLWIAKVPDVTYTGKAIKPEVHIYDSTTRLEEKKDYTISYKNNVNAYVTSSNTAEGVKAPIVTVTGKGNYSGKETAVFHILPVTLDSESADVLDITLAVGNKVQKPVPVIMVNGKKLANKKDFTLEYPDKSADAYKGIGTYKIRAVGKGNYQGELIIPMTIMDKKLISKASVAKIKAQTYTGNPLMPKPVVKHGKDILAEGTGYELEYRNNTEIGTATILVKGIGDYCGQTRVTFPITGGSVSKAKISDTFQMQMEYTGASVTQSCTLTALLGQQTVTLNEGKDYTVRYFDNTKAGKATVVYTGKGAFTGTLKKTYTITPYDIGADSQKKIKYDSSVISAYAKGGSCPVPTITFDSKVLKAGTDFTISYKNNKAVSATGAQMIVKGKGNYKGSITVPFQITTQDLSNLTLTAADGVYQEGKANIYKTALELTDVDQKALSAGKDYDKETIAYVYVNAVNLENGEHRNAGDKVDPTDVIPAETELKVTVYAKEGSNYTGSISAFYRVAKADLKKAKVTVNPQTYNGKQIKPGKDEIKVEMGKAALSADDYDIVSYGTNIEKGTGMLMIKGKGSYGGTKTVSFKIKTKGFLWWNK